MPDGGEFARECGKGSVGSARTAASADKNLSHIDWSALPEGASVGVFEAPSGLLALFRLGNPSHPRVVLVPGATGSKEDFVRIAPLLVTAGYFVESYDLAGQHESADAGPPHGSYEYELFVADMLSHLRSGKTAHLLGYSFAGVVAERVACEHPELVRSLALLSTPPLSGQSFRGVRWIGWLSHLASPAVAARLMVWGIVTNRNRVSASRLEFVRRRFALTNRASVDDMVGLLKKVPDLTEELAKTVMPKLVAVGSRDLWPIRLHKRFADRIGATLAVYETGHSPCETAPHQLVADLVSLYEEAD